MIHISQSHISVSHNCTWKLSLILIWTSANNYHYGKHNAHYSLLNFTWPQPMVWFVIQYRSWCLLNYENAIAGQSIYCWKWKINILNQPIVLLDNSGFTEIQFSAMTPTSLSCLLHKCTCNTSTRLWLYIRAEISDDVPGYSKLKSKPKHSERKKQRKMSKPLSSEAAIFGNLVGDLSPLFSSTMTILIKHCQKINKKRKVVENFFNLLVKMTGKEYYYDHVAIQDCIF